MSHSDNKFRMSHSILKKRKTKKKWFIVEVYQSEF